MVLETKIERVAVLGPSPTYSSMAADGLCRDLLVDASFSCIFDVVKAVNEGRALIGVVPLRNSTIGEIPDTQPALHKFPEVAVILSREVPIALSLIGQSGVAFAEIRTVISKAQALEQCRGWLSKNVPGAVLEEASSTSEGAARVLRDPSVALVGSKEMVDGANLQVLADAIQDNPDNRTEFAIIARPDVFGMPGDWEE